jgi:hypothetical protein
MRPKSAAARIREFPRLVARRRRAASECALPEDAVEFGGFKWLAFARPGGDVDIDAARDRTVDPPAFCAVSSSVVICPSFLLTVGVS